MPKGCSPGQLMFGRDTILLIKHTVDSEIIRQENQTQINKDNILKNRHRVDNNYKVRDNVMLTKNIASKYETPYTVPILITQCFTNETVES